MDRAGLTEVSELIDRVAHLHPPHQHREHCCHGSDSNAGAERKVALQLTLQANVQLAQIIRARGPNTHCSNACASTTAALQLASYMLTTGDAENILVVSADSTVGNADCATLVESFATLRAATGESDVSAALQPFGCEPSGFVFGEAAVAILLSRADAFHKEMTYLVPTAISNVDGEKQTLNPDSIQSRVELLATVLANSAHHGTNLNLVHIAEQVGKAVDIALATVSNRDSSKDATAPSTMSRAEFASLCVYVAHDTFTKTCASTEVKALELVFGRDALRTICMTSTKALTGHCMGAGVEDVLSVLLLQKRKAPPRIGRSRLHTDFKDLLFSDGLPFATPRRFALHLACGMGSHVAIAVYGVDESCSAQKVTGDDASESQGSSGGANDGGGSRLSSTMSYINDLFR